MRKIIYIVLLVVINSASLMAKKKLEFREDGFRILQMTDMHIDPSKKNIVEYYQMLNKMVEHTRPDLLFFTGDIVTSPNALDGWCMFKEWLDKTGIPFAFVMGNHDPEYIHDKDLIYQCLSRSPYCSSHYRINEISEKNAYVLPIYNKGQIAWTLFGVDSGSMSTDESVDGYDWVKTQTIRKVYQQVEQLEKNNLVSKLMFLHIPVPEYAMATKKRYRDFPILGHHWEKVCCPNINSGLFYCLWSTHFKGVFAGHDHDNDYVAQMYGVPLIYGRRTGKGTCYGKLRMGARVIDLNSDGSYYTWIIDRKLKRSNRQLLPMIK